MNLLIADDDKVSRTALRELLALSPDWQVYEADDGQAALDIICDGLQTELCVFDIKMPRLDGLELLQRIRRDPHLKSRKVVMTSAARDRETILSIAKLQISGYLLKPYDPEKVRAVVQPLIAAAATADARSRR